MLENCRNARERWGGVSELIDRWLKERQELLVHYYNMHILGLVVVDTGIVAV